MCPGMAGWEAEVQRLALAVTATMLCCGSPTRAQVVICPPLPPWYPHGWELMVRYPCVIYVMDLPTIHQLITVILQPTRTNVSRCIADHICVPAGGGDDREASTQREDRTTAIAEGSEKVVG
jgi:hypothetical protein